MQSRPWKCLALAAAAAALASLSIVAPAAATTRPAAPRAAAPKALAATTTVVSCDPTPLTVPVKETTFCSATVTAAVGAPPTGNVTFEASGPGSFEQRGVCELTAHATESDCTLAYTATEVGTGSRRIEASYAGDGTHAGGSGLLVVTVSPSPTRFAAPGGSGQAPCTDRADPCSIYLAADGANGAAQPGDQVLLAPGDYSDTAGDLGPGGSVSIEDGVLLRGDPGLQAPRIRLDGPVSQLIAHSEDVVAHLELVSNAAKAELVLDEGTVEGVIARDSAGRALTCELISGAIRDSVCLAEGEEGVAAGGTRATAGPSVVTVQNVTAVGTGAFTTGMDVRASGEARQAVEVTSSIVVSQGPFDVKAVAEGPSAKAEVDLSHSDFGSSVATPLNGGTAKVTPSGGQNGNFDGQPILLADGYHEDPDSITVDTGAADATTAATDVDGRPRILNGTPDMGASELPEQTQGSLVCAPEAVVFPGGGSAVCTATFRTDPQNGSPPEGGVEFELLQNPMFVPTAEAVSEGALSDGGRCTLVAVGPNSSSCHVTYTPGNIGSGQHTLEARYEGDLSRAAAAGGATVRVRAPEEKHEGPGGGGGSKPPAAPQTLFRRKPAKRAASTRARFAFASDQGGASFECRLDSGPFRPCHSPLSKRVRRGAHVFAVRAIVAGLVDPTPAVFRWRVLRR